MWGIQRCKVSRHPIIRLSHVFRNSAKPIGWAKSPLDCYLFATRIPPVVDQPIRPEWHLRRTNVDTNFQRKIFSCDAHRLCAFGGMKRALMVRQLDT